MTFDDVNYENLKKVLNAKKLNHDYVPPPIIIETADDILVGFEHIVNSHPYFANKNVNVKSYLEKNFKKELVGAISNNNTKTLDDICIRVAKTFKPNYSKNFFYDHFMELRDELVFLGGFRALVKKYENHKYNL